MAFVDCGDGLDVGDLSIDGFPMFTPAWRCENLWELWEPPEQRGTNVIRPGVDGSYAVKRRVAETSRDLLMFISGGCDYLGVPAANPMIGMKANLRRFEDNLIAPTGTGQGTRTLLLTEPDGSVRTAEVQVAGMQVSEMRRNAKYCYAAITIIIPAGGLVDVP